MRGASSPLIVLTSIWLILALFRQAFDLVGRLWLPVIFNLLQVLCCIIGLFAICQQRRSLLALFACTNFLSTLYNGLLLLWYEGVFRTATHYADTLSFGLPFSFSFFLKYTPGCTSHFDLKKSIWVQDDCPIRYSHVEAVQCLLHVALALLCMFSTLVILCSSWEKRKHRAQSLPTVSIESLPKVNGRPPSRAPPSLRDTIGSVQSGYVNSSYDSRDESERPGSKTCVPRQQQQPIQAFPNSNYEDIVIPPKAPSSQLQYSKRKSGQKTRPPDEHEAFQTDGVRQSIFRKGKEQRPPRLGKMAAASCCPSVDPLHALVSFDPRSTTVMRVQERVPSDASVSDDDDDDSRDSVSSEETPDVRYTQLQKKPQAAPRLSVEQQTKPPTSYREAIDGGEDATKRETTSPEPCYERISRRSEHDNSSSSDSGVTSAANSEAAWKKSEVMTPGGSLAEIIRQSIRKTSMPSTEDSNSTTSLPGGPMSSTTSISGGLNDEKRKSRFQVEQRNTSAIGHYHSAVELKLVAPAGSAAAGLRQTSMHRLQSVPGLTTAIGLSQMRRFESPGSSKDIGISLTKEADASPGIKLVDETTTTSSSSSRSNRPLISDSSMLV